MTKGLNVQDLLRKRARELLDKGKVSLVLGYRAGRRAGTAVPAFVTEPEQADRLVLNEHCHQNLAVYLPGLRNKQWRIPNDEGRMAEGKGTGRVAVVATGPTSRSVVNLIKENQFDRENLVILGVADPVENPTCPTRNPVLYDEMIGDKVDESVEEKYTDVEEFEKLSPEERWSVLTGDLSRCIRCYACRDVCPNCYCPTCFVDAGQPQWVGRTTDESDTIVFHIMRAMHMAGRCVECGACARACPMGIDLMRINRKTAKVVKERFGHVSGMSIDDPLPLTAFSPDDGQEFIK